MYVFTQGIYVFNFHLKFWGYLLSIYLLGIYHWTEKTRVFT